MGAVVAAAAARYNDVYRFCFGCCRELGARRGIFGIESSSPRGFAKIFSVLKSRIESSQNNLEARITSWLHI